jgi:hypothetical protein
VKGQPDLETAAGRATLHHANADQVAEAAKVAGTTPDQIGAFARGTKIFAPPGRGIGLGTLAHEVHHVHSFLTVPNYTDAYRAATQRGLDRGLSATSAYQLNLYEIRARDAQRFVLRAN